jgi:ethanolamine utilization cobalamin adenosyltransferase
MSYDMLSETKGDTTMAAQFITRDEYNSGNDQLFLRMNTLMNAQMDIMRTEMRANTTMILHRFSEVDTNIAEIRSFQVAMMSTFQAVTADIAKQIGALTDIVREQGEQIREGFAAQAERHNELMVRVERLERNSNPPAAEH